MKTLLSTFLKGAALSLEVRSIDLARDLDRIWNWWVADHVVGNWSMLARLGPPRSGADPYLKADLQRYLERILADGSEVTPLILKVGGLEIGYSEVYRVGGSPLAKHPSVNPDDRGLHLIIGNATYAGRGLATQILAALSKWQLESHPEASKVMGDPDVRNQRAIKAVLKIPGALALGDYPLGYKVAAVIILGTRDRMAELC